MARATALGPNASAVYKIYVSDTPAIETLDVVYVDGGTGTMKWDSVQKAYVIQGTALVKVIYSITPVMPSGTPAPILVGRLDNLPLHLNMDSDGALLFRPEVGGWTPIGCVGEFIKINDSPATLSKRYVLEGNIDLLGGANITGSGMTRHPWVPIGTDSSSYFGGKFDGDNKTLSNLYINSSGDYKGLFGCFGPSSVIVKNTRLVNVSVTGSSYVGGVVGFGGYNGGSITACFVSGTVTGSNIYVGGVTGAITGGNITACSFVGTVSGPADVGGVAGQAKGSSGTTKVTACYSTGTVSSTTNGIHNYAGGVVGELYDGAELTASYSTSTVIGSDAAAGGVVGNSNPSNRNKIIACYSAGMVAGYGYLGGVLGQQNISVFTGTSYWNSSYTHTNRPANGVGFVNGYTNLTSAFNGITDFPAVSGTGWETGTWDGVSATPQGGGWWKDGTTNGSQLPRLCWE